MSGAQKIKTGSEACRFHAESNETDCFLWKMQRHNSVAVNRGKGKSRKMEKEDKEGGMVVMGNECEGESTGWK